MRQKNKQNISSNTYSKSNSLNIWIYLIALLTLCWIHPNDIYGDTSLFKHKEFKLIEEVITQIKENYVTEIDEAKLAEGAIKGMLESLDPHSMYLSSKEYIDMLNQIHKEFYGIGVTLIVENNGLKVTEVHENGPAFRAGVKVGDTILSVNHQDIMNTKNTLDLLEEIRGKPDSVVRIKILRKSKIMNFKITREIIKVEALSKKMISNNSIIYIKIQSFTHDIAPQVKKAFSHLYTLHPNAKGLIIDLRGNVGGDRLQSIAVADLFMSGGKITLSKDKKSHKSEEISASEGDISNDMAMVVLINEGSASGSELVAAAFQDNKRALIVGSRSFGKGSGQSFFKLQNGGAIKITTKMLYTPKNRSIQALGIEPDINIPRSALIHCDEHTTECATGYINCNVNEKSLKNHFNNQFTLDYLNQSSNSNNIENENNKNKNQNKKITNTNTDTKKRNHNTKNPPNEEQKNPSNAINFFAIEEDESQDFQLIRAIDVINAIALISKR